MPTIEISKKDLEKLVGRKVREEDFEYVKADPVIQEDKIILELRDINRPDLLSVEGIARELRSRLGIRKGLMRYKVVPKRDYVVIVNKKVRSVRPLIVCAVVKGLRLDDEAIKQIIQLQEKLCEGFGLRRKEAALGIYDFDKIRWPVTYTTAKPETKFVPLEFEKEMSLREILKKHEKGKKYAYLISSFGEYPILIDSKKNVLSMPPIINSAYSGKVTKETKNIFIEVTGMSHRFIMPVLNIVTTALAERKGIIEQVIVRDRRRTLTPNLKEKIITVNSENINSILGLKFSPREFIALAQKSGFDIRQRKNEFIINYPAYRQDIFDENDIAEDIAISYGYGNISTVMPEITTMATKNETQVFIEKISSLLTGIEAQEIATPILTNKDKLFKQMRLKKKEIIEVANPISETYSCLRSWLLPSVLDFLSKNKKARYQQRVFEIGKALEIEKNEAEEKTKLVFAIAGSKTNFTEVKQILDYLLENLELKCSLEEEKHESFIPGRVGKVMVKEKTAGIIGEIHPNVLEKFNLLVPIAAFELDLNALE